MLIGVAVGVAAEFVARVFKLWIYRQPQTPIINVLAMFGLIMGGIAGAVPRIGLLPAFGVAFAVGLVYEVANLQWLDWWYFPEEHLAFVHGHTAIVLVLSLLWGAVPVMIVGAQQRALPMGRPERRAAHSAAVSGQTRLEALQQREAQLIQKLEALRERERDIETRLEQTRALKQMLVSRQPVRKPGAQDATPTP